MKKGRRGKKKEKKKGKEEEEEDWKKKDKWKKVFLIKRHICKMENGDDVSVESFV